MQKICFSDRYGLTAAVLNGTKTLTRRCCKDYSSGQLILSHAVKSFRFYPQENIVEFLMRDGSVMVSVPKYKYHEVVAVAQSYKSIHNEMMRDYSHSKYDAFRSAMVDNSKGWTNKLFVKPNLMPYKIKITNVRIELLQDITNEDCLKEGILNSELLAMPFGIRDTIAPNGVAFDYKSPREAFASLINQRGVGRLGLWEDNPFVIVYEFCLMG